MAVSSCAVRSATPTACTCLTAIASHRFISLRRRPFYELSSGEGENPQPKLYSFVAYKALQPIARWVQVNRIFTVRNQGKTKPKATHANTHNTGKGKGCRCTCSPADGVSELRGHQTSPNAAARQATRGSLSTRKIDAHRSRHRRTFAQNRSKLIEMYLRDHALNEVERHRSAPSWSALIQTRARISPGDTSRFASSPL
jgi:hypothetical protein